MSQRPSTLRWRSMMMLIGMLWIAFALRMEHLTEQSLWFDEASTAVSLFYGRLNPLIVEARALIYLLLIAPFAAIVPTDLGLRWPSIVAGILLIPLSYRIATKLHSPRAGLIAAALVTISPQFIHYSREARYYSIVPMIALITLWLGLHLTRKRSAVDGLFILSVILLTGVHLLSILWITTLLVSLAIRRKLTGEGARWSVLFGTAFGAALMVIGLHVLGMLGSVSLAQGVTEGAVDAPHRLLVAFFTTGWGMIIPRNPKIILLALFLVLVAAGLWRTFMESRQTLGLLIVLTVVPVVELITLTYLYRPIFLYRYLMPSYATLVVLTAILLAQINLRWIASGALGVLLVSGILAYILEPDREREDWRDAATYLASELEKGDQVFACRLRAAMPLVYYLPDLRPYYLGELGGASMLIREHIQPLPAAASSASDVWIVHYYSLPCRLADYGIDVSDISEEPSDIMQFKRVILLRYEGLNQ